MTFIDLLQASPAYLITSAAVLGLIIGSFLNVVIHRLPRMLQSEWRQQCRELLELEAGDTGSEIYNLALPASHCPDCGARIPLWHNIPLLSYLFLRGRCGHCGATISLRYPIVELLTATLSAILAWQLGPSWPLLAALLFTWSLIALSFIDLEHHLLPDQITLPLLWLGLLVNLAHTFTTLESAVIGAMVGYLFLWLIFHAYRLLTAKEGFGYGDFKLLAAVGAWLGWQQIPLIILLASVAGALIGLTLILLRRHQMHKPLPFGPYLAVSGWVGLLWGDDIIHAYLRFAGIL
jgi:leader peptidase (prepilin peptidase)/N-methyltransferase